MNTKDIIYMLAQDRAVYNRDDSYVETVVAHNFGAWESCAVADAFAKNKNKEIEDEEDHYFSIMVKLDRTNDNHPRTLSRD